MPVRPVLRMGDPRLLLQSEPVHEFDTPELHAFIKDMFDTMNSFNGVGIAAPQIGINKRIIIFSVNKNPRYPYAEFVPTTILINPQIIFLDHEMEDGWEGCLSVPGIRGLVPRYLNLKYQGYDPLGNLIEREAHNFHARVLQHECDHLDGVLFPRRIKDLTMIGFEEEVKDTINAFYLQKNK